MDTYIDFIIKPTLIIAFIVLLLYVVRIFQIISNECFKKFKIVSFKGAFDVMLNDKKLITKPTFQEAKQWLDEHKDDYRKKVLYKEKF